MDIQWSLVLFTGLSGTGAWMFACICIDEFRRKTQEISFFATILTIVLLAVGGLCSITHLSHPERMLAALGHPTSGIFIEVVLVGLTALCALVYAVLLKRSAPATVRKVFAVIGIALAIAISYECGASYMMSSQLAWNTVTLPLGYMGTAAASGAALYLLLCVIFKMPKEALSFAEVLALAGGALGLVLALAHGFAGGVALSAHAPVFWLLCVVCGGVVPIALAWYVRAKVTLPGADPSAEPEESAAAAETDASATAADEDEGEPGDDAGKGKGQMLPELPYAIAVFAGALIGALAFRCLMWLASDPLMSLFDVII